MSRPVPLLKHAAMARPGPGTGSLLRHQPCQLSLFADAVGAPAAADAPAAPGLDLVDEQQRQEDPAWVCGQVQSHVANGANRSGAMRPRSAGVPNDRCRSASAFSTVSPLAMSRLYIPLTNSSS